MKAKVRVCLLCVSWLAITGASPSQNPAKPHSPPRDADGFPLPAGAVARLGTLRWRTTEYVTSLAFSRDGKRLVSADRNSVRLWEVASGKEIGAVAQPFVTKAVFNHDGSRILLLRDTTLAILNGHDAKKLGEYEFAGITNSGAKGVVPHPKNDTVAVIMRVGKVCLARSDKVVPDSLTVLAEMPGRTLLSAAWSNDGKTLGVADTSGDLWLVDPDAKKAKGAGQGGNKKSFGGGLEIRRFLFTADDKIAVLFRAGAPIICDLATGKVVQRFDPGSGGSAGWLSEDGKQFMIGGNGQERVVSQWDMQTGDLKHKYKYPNQTTGRNNSGMAISPDGKLAASSDGHRISVWDIRTGKSSSALEGHHLPIERISFLNDGQRICTSSTDGQAVVWDAATGKLLHHFAHDDRTGYGDGPSFVNNGTALVARAEEGIRFWDVNTGKVAAKVRLMPDLPRGLGAFDSALSDVAKSGKTLLWGTSGGVHVWDVKERKTKHIIQGPIGHIALSPDERRLVEWWDYSLALWDIPTGKRLWQLKADKDIADPVRLLAFTVDSRQVLVDRGIRQRGERFVFLDVDTGKTQRKLDCDDGVRHAVFTSDGRWFATVSSRRDVRLWETATLLHFVRIVPYRPLPDGNIEKPYEQVRLTFDREGLRLAMGVDDGSGLVYSLPKLFGSDSAKLDDKAWETLAGGDGKEVLGLMMTLASRPQEATAWLRGKLQKAQGVPDKKLQELIANLESSDFSKRLAANTELIKLGDLAEDALRASLDKNPDLETKRRIQAILETVDMSDRHFPSPFMRVVRGIQVLEYSDTPDAWKLLEELTQGDARARQTRHAQAALERRKSRSN